ncbi:MAG: LysR family transcriptional regulator [Proteobacteria bacterium]|nr:LysR family transcriptional regulator [Pseudomonadota bacterium]
MELNHLKYFYFVAREGGFSRASRMLKVAQPSITKTVKTLEKSLGVQLFERNGRSVALTKDGSDLFRKCEIIFAQVESIQSKAAFGGVSSSIKSTISIGAAEPIASHLLPSILKHFLRDFPHVYPQVIATTAAEVTRPSWL